MTSQQIPMSKRQQAKQTWTVKLVIMIKVRKGARRRSTEILVKTTADPNDQDTKDDATLYRRGRTWRRGNLPPRQTFRKASCKTDIPRVSLNGRHYTGLWRTCRNDRGSVDGCLQDRSRDAGVVKNSFWFLSAVKHFDQMTGSIINQLSILTRSYHIRDHGFFDQCGGSSWITAKNTRE